MIPDQNLYMGVRGRPPLRCFLAGVLLVVMLRDEKADPMLLVDNPQGITC